MLYDEQQLTVVFDKRLISSAERDAESVPPPGRSRMRHVVPSTINAASTTACRYESLIAPTFRPIDPSPSRFIRCARSAKYISILRPSEEADASYSRSRLS